MYTSKKLFILLGDFTLKFDLFVSSSSSFKPEIASKNYDIKLTSEFIQMLVYVFFKVSCMFT